MGLFDKILGRSGEAKSNNELTTQSAKDPLAPSIISRAIAERECNLSKAIKIPLTDTVLSGSSLMQLAPSIKSIITGNQIGNGSLVRVMFQPGIKGKMVTDKTGLTLGTISKSDGGLAQARFLAVDPTILAAQAAMAAIMMEINKKLDTIQETQQRILDFLEQDKQAEQQGNLNTLTDILEGYKHNWDNAQYLQNHHMKVLDIKQTAEKNIIFYQEQIGTKIKKLPAIHLDQAVKTAITDLSKQFSNYRMAVYLFSFASFLEVMLLGNFRQAYLDQVSAKVQEYSKQYQTQFFECRDLIKKFSTESVETKVLAGVGNASKIVGKLIASAPILSQGPVDEWLQESGEKLLKSNDEKAKNAASMFNTEEKIDSDVFIDSIRNVNMISNQTTDILFDGEALYLATA